MRTSKISLPQLIDQLRKAVVLQEPNERTNNLTNEISRRLTTKQDRFRLRYQLPIADWASTIKSSPGSVEDFLNHEVFSILLKRDIDICFFHGQARLNIWDKLSGQQISSKMYQDRLLILNPLTKRPTEAQSWSRPSSISRTRPDHLASYGNPNKSKFLAWVALDELEMQVFNLAAGQLVNESTIHFYARFIEIIGHLKNGASTEYARIECTRERRIKGSGFRVQLHSYPIAMKDIDISAVPSLRIHLKSEKQFKVPRVA